ncbi:MAG: ribonuclease III [Proteobacteria bacterium]|jgi:ribonuclease III|nr:ribonuclease III [Pseudomonadota bacterium]
MQHQKLELQIGYSFKNHDFLIEALTHPSKKLENKKIKSYQRLEFLGDKILNFIIAQELFTRFPNENEGEISRRHAHLVCGSVCYEVAQKLDIFPYIVFSKAQQNDESSNKMKIGEDAIEAMIGAIFLDSNIDAVQKFIQTHWVEYILGNITPPKDAKSSLQEYMQRTQKTIPQYKVIHNGTNFTANIIVDGTLFYATASTKKEAEKLAAEKALQELSSQNLL